MLSTAFVFVMLDAGRQFPKSTGKWFAPIHAEKLIGIDACYVLAAAVTVIVTSACMSAARNRSLTDDDTRRIWLSGFGLLLTFVLLHKGLLDALIG